MDRLIEFLNFLILATNAGSINWNEDKENIFVLIDPDDNEAAVKVAKEGVISISITAPKRIIKIDTNQFPSLSSKLTELYDTVVLNAAWNSDNKREIISDMYQSMDRLILRLG